MLRNIPCIGLGSYYHPYYSIALINGLCKVLNILLTLFGKELPET